MTAILRPHGDISLDEEAQLAFHYAGQLDNQDFPVTVVMLADEMQTRLEHLNFHVKSVAVLLREHSVRALLPLSLACNRELDQLRMIMYTHVDAFYYGAHRVQKILQRAKLPHIVGYPQVKEIVFLRDLIEHSIEKKRYGHAVAWRAMVHPVDGPMLSASSDATPGAPPHPSHARDRGIFGTVKAFKASLQPVLARAVDALGGKLPTVEESLKQNPKGGRAP